MPFQKKPSRRKTGDKKNPSPSVSEGDSVIHLRKLGHDLNNALSPITLYAGILKSMIKDEKSIAMLSNIEECVKRSAAIAEELLALGHDSKSTKTTCDKIDQT